MKQSDEGIFFEVATLTNLPIAPNKRTCLETKIWTPELLEIILHRPITFWINLNEGLPIGYLIR